MNKNNHVKILDPCHGEREKENTYKNHEQQTGWRKKSTNKTLSFFKIHRKKAGGGNISSSLVTSIFTSHFMKTTEAYQRYLKLIGAFDWVASYIIAVYVCK